MDDNADAKRILLASPLADWRRQRSSPHHMAQHHPAPGDAMRYCLCWVTWLTTVRSWLTPVSDNCVLQTLEHSSVGRAAVLETGPLPLQDHKSGTVCRPISDYVTCHTASSGGYWRHFYLDSDPTTKCELFLTAPNRNLTYLLMY